VIEVFSPKDMNHTMARGSKKKTINQKLPGIARNQKTAGFFRQLSKVTCLQRCSRSPGNGRFKGGISHP
jgi:hypothetical protein